MINGLGRWSESLDRAVFILTLSSPLIINHQSVLNVHLQSPVSSVSERQRLSTYGVAEPVQLGRFSARLYPFTGGFHNALLRDLPPEVPFVQVLSEDCFVDELELR